MKDLTMRRERLRYEIAPADDSVAKQAAPGSAVGAEKDVLALDVPVEDFGPVPETWRGGFCDMPTHKT